ncbi:hypothetical protein M0804_008952 [Polistes exclamans]|nr:hypothetical protein M0804_008952 [Polistes exclamans]
MGTDDEDEVVVVPIESTTKFMGSERWRIGDSTDDVWVYWVLTSYVITFAYFFFGCRSSLLIHGIVQRVWWGGKRGLQRNIVELVEHANTSLKFIDDDEDEDEDDDDSSRQ